MYGLDNFDDIQFGELSYWIVKLALETNKPNSKERGYDAC